MSIDIDLSHNILAVEDWILKMGEDEVARNLKLSMNRSMARIRKHTIKILKRQLAIQKTTLFKDRMRIKRASGKSIPNLEAQIIFSGKPIPLMEFVIGSKQLIKQKGLRVQKRRKLKARIKPGRTIKIKSGFIQKKNTKQVFKGKRGDGFKTQGVSSLATLIKRPKVKDLIEKMALGVFGKEFSNMMQRRIDRFNSELNRAPMKKMV